MEEGVGNGYIFFYWVNSLQPETIQSLLQMNGSKLEMSCGSFC